MPENNGNEESRLDRMERMLDMLIQGHVSFEDEHRRFQEEHKRLRTAQVLMSDQLQKLDARLSEKLERITDNMDRLWAISDKHQERLDHADKELEKLRLRIAELSEGTDAKIQALIEIVDGIIRNRPPQPPQ